MTRKRLDTVLLILLGFGFILWLIIPFAIAILWSLTDPAKPWTAATLLPPVMSFVRWSEMWQHSGLKQALLTSYTLAPTAAVTCLLLAMPTALALGRFNFPGRSVAKILCLLPLVVPSFVTSIFFTALLFTLGLQGFRFGAIVFAHSVLFLPYAIRIMTISFEQVRQDHVDAARDLGASPWARFSAAYLPALRPGILLRS
nr:ABC transporter permease subunit [Marinicella sp. W31]MDC2878234.1 ABC transporter permease subunit [Marinicella sp. W31]